MSTIACQCNKLQAVWQEVTWWPHAWVTHCFRIIPFRDGNVSDLELDSDDALPSSSKNPSAKKKSAPLKLVAWWCQEHVFQFRTFEGGTLQIWDIILCNGSQNFGTCKWNLRVQEIITLGYHCPVHFISSQTFLVSFIDIFFSLCNIIYTCFIVFSITCSNNPLAKPAIPSRSALADPNSFYQRTNTFLSSHR